MNYKGTTYKQATVSDVREVIQLVQKYRFQEDGSGFLLPVTVEELIGRTTAGNLYVATHKDRVVGTFSLVEYDGLVELRSVAVEGQYEGHGIGTALVKMSVQEAQSRGYSKLITFARKDSKAQKLYLGEGFVPTEKPPEKLKKDCEACFLHHAGLCNEQAMIRELFVSS